MTERQRKMWQSAQKGALFRKGVPGSLLLVPMLFADALAFAFAVLVIVMFCRFGVPVAETTLTMSLLYLPLVARPLVEKTVTCFNGTPMVWIMSAELVSAVALWALAFTLPGGYWMQGTLCFLMFCVSAAVFHNVAVERFYAPGRVHGSSIHAGRTATFARAAAVMAVAGVLAMIAGNLEVVTRNVRYSWGCVCYVAAGAFAVACLFNICVLGKCCRQSVGTCMQRGFCRCGMVGMARMSIVSRGRVKWSLLLVLMLVPLGFASFATQLFLVDALHNGGLGLSPQEYGLVQGTAGVAGIAMGLVLGRSAIARCGLRRWLAPMSAALAAGNAFYLYLSFNLSAGLFAVGACLFAAGLLCGFGIAACRALVALLAHGTDSLMRRAFAISLSALTLMLSAMPSGAALHVVGYRQFFIYTFILACVPALALLSVCLAGIVGRKGIN